MGKSNQIELSPILFTEFFFAIPLLSNFRDYILVITKTFTKDCDDDNDFRVVYTTEQIYILTTIFAAQTEL